MAHSGAPCGGSELDGSPAFLNFLATLPDLSCNVEEEVENLSSRTLMNEFNAEEGKGVHNYDTLILTLSSYTWDYIHPYMYEYCTYSRNASGVYE